MDRSLRAGAGFSRNVGAIRREGKYVATKVDGNAVETLVKGSPAQRDVLEVLHVLRYPNCARELFCRWGARRRAGSGLYPVDLALLVPRLLFALRNGCDLRTQGPSRHPTSSVARLLM